MGKFMKERKANDAVYDTIHEKRPHYSKRQVSRTGTSICRVFVRAYVIGLLKDIDETGNKDSVRALKLILSGMTVNNNGNPVFKINFYDAADYINEEFLNECDFDEMLRLFDECRNDSKVVLEARRCKSLA